MGGAVFYRPKIEFLILVDKNLTRGGKHDNIHNQKSFISAKSRDEGADTMECQLPKKRLLFGLCCSLIALIVKICCRLSINCSVIFRICCLRFII